MQVDAKKFRYRVEQVDGYKKSAIAQWYTVYIVERGYAVPWDTQYQFLPNRFDIEDVEDVVNDVEDDVDDVDKRLKRHDNNIKDDAEDIFDRIDRLSDKLDRIEDDVDDLDETIAP